MITPSSSRNLNIDLIRVLAMLMIVTAHITALIFARPDFFGKSFWWLNNMLLSVCRMGTPLFFMISGYLIGDKKRSWAETFQHTFLRLGVPFAGFYVLSNIVIAVIHSTPIFPDFFHNLFLGGGNYLYFLVGLGILYLLNPILQKLTAHLTEREFRNVIVLLLANTALYTFGAYILSTELEIPNPTFLYWFLTLGFFLLGMYLKKFPVKNDDVKRDLTYVVLPLIINMLSAYVFQRLFLETHQAFFAQIANYSQSYLGVSVMLPAVYLFKLVVSAKGWKQVLQKYQHLLSHLAQNAFGIYLVHMLLLEYFLFRTPLTIDHGPFNPAIMIVLIWIFLLVASDVFTVIVKNIPLLRIIIGLPA